MVNVDTLGHIPKAQIVAYRTGLAQSIPSAAWTEVDLTADGTGNEAPYKITHSPTTDFTIQIPGWYDIEYQFNLDKTTNGSSREARVKVNGSVVGGRLVEPPFVPASQGQLLVRMMKYYLIKDDVITFEVYQDDGSALNLYSGRDISYAIIVMIR